MDERMDGWLDEWDVNRKHFSWMIGWMDVNQKHNFPWMRNSFFMDDKMNLCVDRKHYFMD